MEEMYLSEEDQILFNEDFRIIENNKIFPYMLFHSLTCIFPMSRYEDDLFKINDYIYYNRENLHNILDEKRELIEIAKNTDIDGEYKYEGVIAREDDAYKVEWMIETVNKSNNIILLLSFLEGTLKEIAEWYEEDLHMQCENIKRKREISKIVYYLNRISTCCNYDLILVLNKQLEVINKAKIIRNILVHEWDAYYNEKNRIKLDSELKEFKVTDLIDSISKILYMCEYAGVKGNILKPTDNIVSKYLIIERQLRLCEYDDDLINIVISG